MGTQQPHARLRVTGHTPGTFEYERVTVTLTPADTTKPVRILFFNTERALCRVHSKLFDASFEDDTFEEDIDITIDDVVYTLNPHEQCAVFYLLCNFLSDYIIPRIRSEKTDEDIQREIEEFLNS